MKCVVMWLNMCCFPIERHQIRVWAVKVSFDPRQFAHTVTYMDISTSSCSLQYQLSYKARMVSVGWVGSDWLDSECNNAHFQAYPQSYPLWNFPPKKHCASCKTCLVVGALRNTGTRRLQPLALLALSTVAFLSNAPPGIAKALH